MMTLGEKIEALTAEQLTEVEDFVKFIRYKHGQVCPIGDICDDKKPVVCLRWVVRDGIRVLQQQWAGPKWLEDGSDVEWRDVPTCEEKSKDEKV